MKNIYFTIFLFQTLLFSLQAQPNEVRRLRVEPQDEQIVFTFDIIADSRDQTFNICLKSYDDKITPFDTKGIIGEQQSPGLNLKIYWNYAEDGYSRNQIDINKLDVVAIRAITLPSAPPEILTYVGFVGAVAGVGGAAFGATEFFKTRNQYTDFKNYEYPVEITLAERSDYFDELNNDYKTSQYLIFGGAVISVASVWVIWNRRKILAKRKKIKRAQLMKTQCDAVPVFKNWEPIVSKNGIGLAFSW